MHVPLQDNLHCSQAHGWDRVQGLVTPPLDATGLQPARSILVAVCSIGYPAHPHGRNKQICRPWVQSQVHSPVTQLPDWTRVPLTTRACTDRHWCSLECGGVPDGPWQHYPPSAAMLYPALPPRRYGALADLCCVTPGLRFKHHHKLCH